MVDRVSVALALIGSNNAPVCNLEPLRRNTLIERDLADGAVLVISSQSNRPGRFIEPPIATTTASAAHQHQHHHHHQHHAPRGKSPQTTMRQLEAEAERKHLESQRAEEDLLRQALLNPYDDSPPQLQPPAGSSSPLPAPPALHAAAHMGKPVEGASGHASSFPPPRHSHRRSLSTSEHLHFALKGGPPTLSAAAFEPDDHLLSSTDSNSSSPKSVSQDEDEADDGRHSVHSSSSSNTSSSSNGSVIKTKVYNEDDEDDEDDGDDTGSFVAADTPKSVVFTEDDLQQHPSPLLSTTSAFTATGDASSDFNDTPRSVLRVPIPSPLSPAAAAMAATVMSSTSPPASETSPPHPKPLTRTPSLNAAALILKRRSSFTTGSTLSPRPRLGSAPDVLSIAELMGGNHGSESGGGDDLGSSLTSSVATTVNGESNGGNGADSDDDDGGSYPIRKTASKESLASQDTARSSPHGRRSTRNSHRRHHSRQLSQPTLAGGGVDIELGATNTSNEAGGSGARAGQAELVLPDGLVVTSHGITSSPSPSEKTGKRRHLRVDSGAAAASSSSSHHHHHHHSHSPSKLSQPTPRLLAPGQFCSNDLETLGLIGKGTAGIVTKALHVTALRIVAVKSVQKFDFTKRETTIAEIRALHRKMVPFLESSTTWPAGGGDGGAGEDAEEASCIVGFYDAYIPRDGASVNMVLEWMDGGSLQDLVDRKTAKGERLSEQFIAVACRRMLKGLVELQESRLLHRDMKPANVLVSRSGAVKLSDFGVSIAFGLGDLSNAQTYIGSLSYMAPERVNASKRHDGDGDEDEGGYSYASDLWAVGLIAYVCATGDYPFKKQFDDDGFWGLYQAVEDDIPPLAQDKHSAALAHFVAQCLRKDPLQRPTAQELLASDPFVQLVPDAREAVASQFAPQDQQMARQELDRLLDIVVESHGRRYAAATVYEPPVFSINRLRVLCGQLDLVMGAEELRSVLDGLNSRVQQACGGGGAGAGEVVVVEAAGSSDSSEEEEEDGEKRALQHFDSSSSWKQNHLKLELQ